MKINEAIQLVIPIGDLHAFHTPISRAVFEANYRIIAATKAAISEEGPFYQLDAGPKIASLALMDAAREDSQKRGMIDEDGMGSDADAQALLTEIKRLTMILCPTDKGWEQLPVDSAISSGHMDSEDWKEAESAIVFFTCLYAVSTKANRARIAENVAGLLQGQITSLSISEFVDSLPPSTAESA